MSRGDEGNVAPAKQDRRRRVGEALEGDLWPEDTCVKCGHPTQPASGNCRQPCYFCSYTYPDGDCSD